MTFEVPHAIKWCGYKTLFINYIIISYYKQTLKKKVIDKLHIITIIN